MLCTGSWFCSLNSIDTDWKIHMTLMGWEKIIYWGLLFQKALRGLSDVAQSAHFLSSLGDGGDHEEQQEQVPLPYRWFSSR